MKELFLHTCSFGKRLVDIIFGLIIGLFLGMDILFARSIDMAKAGVSLWIFIVVGAFIILLQLVPAFILFTSFIGTSLGVVQKSVKIKETEIKGECCKEVDNV